MKNKKIISLLFVVLIIACYFVFNNSNNQEATKDEQIVEVTNYTFKNEDLLNQHYKKHGKDMGFKNAEEYEQAANKVINNPNSLHKLEKEDNDDVYYLENTNEFVVLSTEGYIRTYFYPDAGKDYFDRQ